jgi:hypothetical protein
VFLLLPGLWSIEIWIPFINKTSWAVTSCGRNGVHLQRHAAPSSPRRYSQISQKPFSSPLPSYDMYAFVCLVKFLIHTSCESFAYEEYWWRTMQSSDKGYGQTDGHAISVLGMRLKHQKDPPWAVRVWRHEHHKKRQHSRWDRSSTNK